MTTTRRENESSKEIISVNAEDMCSVSYPCIHMLAIKYKDGTSIRELSDGETILETYGNYLNDTDKNHFLHYMRYNLFSNKIGTRLTLDSNDQLECNSDLKR